jgi:hypothetical protein
MKPNITGLNQTGFGRLSPLSLAALAGLAGLAGFEAFAGLVFFSTDSDMRQL